MGRTIALGRGVVLVVAITTLSGVVLAGAAAPVRAAVSRIDGTLYQVQGSPGAQDLGVNFHGMWTDYTDLERLEVLDALAAAHVGWVRIDMGWSSFLTDCSDCWEQWYIDQADFVVDAAIDRGLKVLVMLWRTPGWANGGAGVYAPPDDPADYGDMAYWAARHFRGRVSAWEVWNEPNQDDFWAGNVDQYVALLAAAYPQFKAADPAASVVLGGPAYNDTNWLSQAYAVGAGGSFDIMATHPYMAPSDLPPETPDLDGTNIWLIAHVSAVHDLMVAEGDGDKPIWFTEFGWSSHPNDGNEENWELGVGAGTQARYLSAAIGFIRAQYPYVTNMFWYDERNDETGDPQTDNYGLMDRDLRHKAAYSALQKAARRRP